MDLIGENLVLRTPLLDDAAEVSEAVLSSMNELKPWMVWATPTYDIEAATDWITGKTGEHHPFVMVDHHDQIVGSCGLNKVDTLNNSANLGYWVRSDRTGHGYATTATRLLAGYGLDELGLNRLVITMSTRNEPSRRVAARAGAHYEGVARGLLNLNDGYHDAHVFSFISSDDRGSE